MTMPALGLSFVSPSCLLTPSCQSRQLQHSAWGAIVALSKPAGGVRGIVGDFLRRLVARTMAQQFALAFEAATHTRINTPSPPVPAQRHWRAPCKLRAMATRR